ncbi:MAG: PHP domain-containing protein, partial [Alphaproteobacteria bacterium]
MPDVFPRYTRRTLPEGSNYAANPRSPYVELGLASCFSFLRGASDATDLVLTAWSQGYDVLGIADLNTMAGVVRLHVEAGKANLRPAIGCRLALIDGQAFLAYPRDRQAYGRLCTLLSKGKMHDVKGRWQAKGICDLTLDDLADHAEGLQLIALPGENLAVFEAGFA